MADKMLNTRIALKYDSLTNWNSSTIALRPGEVAFAYIEAANGGDKIYGSIDNAIKQPTILFKVGTGNPADSTSWKKFNELPWGSALAADVYSWAKTDADGFVKLLTETGLGKDATKFATADTTDAIELRLSAAEAALGLGDTAGENSFSASVTKLMTEVYGSEDDETDGLVGRVAALEDTVNNETTGLTKDVTDLKDAINDEETGLATKASQSDLDAAELAIETLNGDATKEGSVAKKIADAIAAENLGQYATDDELKGATDRVKTLEDAVNHAETGLATKASQSDLDAAELAIETLNGDVNKEGSVAKKIADAIAAENLGQYATDEDLKGATDRVKTLEDAVNHTETGLATKASQADLDAAELAIETLQGQITGLTGAMHFVGVKNEVPTDVTGYKDGDVIVVGEKEYVFNGGKFVEFGDVSAEGDRIKALEDAVNHETTGLATKASQSDLDAAELAIETLNGGVDKEGSVAKTVADAIAAENLAQYAKASDLKTVADAVNHAETGLATKASQADLDAAELAIETLNGDATKEGSVAKKIADAITAENLGQYATDEDLKGATDRVKALEDAVNHAETGLATKASQADLDAAELAIEKLNGTGEGSVAKTVADAIAAENLAQYAKAADLKTVADAVNDTETGLAKRALQSDLDATNLKVTALEDRIGVAGDTLIFNCGSATEVV